MHQSKHRESVNLSVTSEAEKTQGSTFADHAGISRQIVFLDDGKLNDSGRKVVQSMFMKDYHRRKRLVCNN